jgi:hypothetical protein
MTDKQFCEIESAITGEPIDSVEQIKSVRFTGRELKTYLESAIALSHGRPIYIEENQEFVMNNTVFTWEKKEGNWNLKIVRGLVENPEFKVTEITTDNQ